MTKHTLRIKEDIDSLYNEYIDDLYMYAQNLGFNKQFSMDAIHDVFCKLYVDTDIVANISNTKFYLFRSLKNRLIDIYRSQREFVDYENNSKADSMPFILKVTIEDKLIEDEDRLKLKERVDKILAVLTDRQREIIYLRFMMDYDYEEISQLMDISVPACHNLMSKTIKKLKKENLSLFLLLLTLLK